MKSTKQLLRLTLIGIISFAMISFVTVHATPVRADSMSLSSPSWWNGSDCDQGHNTPHSPNYSVNALSVGISDGKWNELEACYPHHLGGGVWLNGDKSGIIQPDFHTTIPGGGPATRAWECVELSERYLYLLAGLTVPPSGANGDTLVNNYFNAYSSKYPGLLTMGSATGNGSKLTPGNVPQIGDVVSIIWPDGISVHTGIITNVVIDGSGNGTLSIFQQNALDGNYNPNPYGTLAVTGWQVGDETTHKTLLQAFSWLHYNGATKVTTPLDGYMVSTASVVSGWACDDSNGGSTSRVDLYANGTYNGGGTYLGSVQANGNRPDLVQANVCGSTAPHGFSFDAKGLGAGSHSIWAYNIVSGQTVTLGNSGNVIVAPHPNGYMSNTASVVSGWACDDSNADATSRVDLYANGPYNAGGTYLGSVQANGNRTDLIQAGVCDSTAPHGFSFDAKGLGAGSHSIWAYNIVSGQTVLVGNSGNVTVTPQLNGYMVSTASVVSGWACDYSNADATSRVDIYANGAYKAGGTYLGSVQANGNRTDLIQAGVCDSTAPHGFSFDASGLGAGSHSIWAYNIVSGQTVLIGNSGAVIVTN